MGKQKGTLVIVDHVLKVVIGIVQDHTYHDKHVVNNWFYKMAITFVGK